MTPSHRSLILAAGFTYASVFGFARFAYSVMLPSMRDGLGADVSAMGFMATSNLAGYVLGSGLAMLLTARFRNDVVSLAGLVGVCGGLLLMAVTPGVTVAMILMFVLGIGSALAFIATTAVVNNASSDRRGRLIGFATAGIGLGTTACSLVIAAFLRVGEMGWRLSWLALGVLLTAAVPWIHRTLSSIDRSGEEARAVAHAGGPATWAAMSLDRRLWVFPMYICWGAGYIVYVMFVTAFLHDERGMTAASAALVYSVMGVAAILGGPLVGPLSDRWGRRPLLVAALVTCAAGSALVLVADNVLLLALSAAMFGMPISAVGTLIAAFVGDMWSSVEQGPIFGGVTMMFGIAQALTPTGVGIATNRLGTLVPSFAFAISALLAGAAIALFLPARAGAKPPRRQKAQPCQV